MTSVPPGNEEGNDEPLQIADDCKCHCILAGGHRGGYRIWEGGWPRHISFVGTKEGVGQMQVVPIAFTGTDWLILILAVAVQASLICMVWNAWRAGSSDSKSRQQ